MRVVWGRADGPARVVRAVPGLCLFPLDRVLHRGDHLSLGSSRYHGRRCCHHGRVWHRRSRVRERLKHVQAPWAAPQRSSRQPSCRKSSHSIEDQMQRKRRRRARGMKDRGAVVSTESKWTGNAENASRAPGMGVLVLPVHRKRVNKRTMAKLLARTTLYYSPRMTDPCHDVSCTVPAIPEPPRHRPLHSREASLQFGNPTSLQCRSPNIDTGLAITALSSDRASITPCLLLPTFVLGMTHESPARASACRLHLAESRIT